MSQTPAFVARLTNERIFGPAERAKIRAMAGRGLDERIPAFDIFTGIWWPLGKKSQAAPRREVAWMVVNLYGTFPVPHFRPSNRASPTLAHILGISEPPHRACPHAAVLSGPIPDQDPAKRQFIMARRFRRRFDALLSTPLGALEPHLRWALSMVTYAFEKKKCRGIDWIQLTDHLSIWDRGEEHRLHRDVRDIWAEQYLTSTQYNQERSY